MDFRPEFKAKPPKIRPQMPRCRIAPIELAPPCEFDSSDRSETGWLDDLDKRLDALGMQILGKALELRCQKHSVCMIDLLGCVSPAAPLATDRGVSILHLIQFPGPRAAPPEVGLG